MKIVSIQLVSIILTLVFASASDAQEIRPLLNHNEKFTINGKVYKDDLYGFPTYYEDGALNGVAYRIYFHDGSGTFEGVEGNGLERKWNKNKTAAEGLKDIADMDKNWMIHCREDAVDILTCFMVIPGISVFIDTNGQEFVAIHGDGDPRGATVGVRLDSSENFVGGKDSQFGGATAKQIIDRLKSAKKITTSFQGPKDRAGSTTTFHLYGFNEAFTYINWVIDKCKGVYDSRKGARPDTTGSGFQTCNMR